MPASQSTEPVNRLWGMPRDARGNGPRSRPRARARIRPGRGHAEQCCRCFREFRIAVPYAFSHARLASGQETSSCLAQLIVRPAVTAVVRRVERDTAPYLTSRFRDQIFRRGGHQGSFLVIMKPVDGRISRTPCFTVKGYLPPSIPQQPR
jgi:hypothetical protein